MSLGGGYSSGGDGGPSLRALPDDHELGEATSKGEAGLVVKGSTPLQKGQTLYALLSARGAPLGGDSSPWIPGTGGLQSPSQDSLWPAALVGNGAVLLPSQHGGELCLNSLK